MREIRTALITGPTGAIGIALCKLLIEKGIKVFAVCRPESHRAGNLPDGVTKIDCDLSELNSLSSKINEKIDAFFHFGWANTVGNGRNDMYSQNNNVKYALDAVHVANALGCKIFIGSGSQAEYGRRDEILTPETACFPENGYGMAKLCAGQMCRVECEKLGMDFVWTRILSVYGPYDGANSMVSTVIRKLVDGEKPLLTAGMQMWDYLYSGDAAKAFYLLALEGISGKTYVVANGKSRKLREFVEDIRDEVNQSAVLGFGEIESVNPVSLTADISEIKNDTGFVPETDFKEGIKKTVEYIKSLK